MVKEIVISLCTGVIIGFFLGRLKPRNMGIYQFLRKIYTNLDNFILLSSVVVVCISIYLSSIGKLEAFATSTINIFGSIVFSWLLTKKSAEIDFKKREEELALRSYRYINNIESSAKTACKTIETYIGDKELDENVRLMLSRAMDQIKYIQGGINTSKQDWYDMLSTEEKKRHKEQGMGDEEKYGKVDMELNEMEYNQEDA